MERKLETDMEHEPWRERLALELYGELEGDESARLEEHLAGCGECRAFGDELRAGLGRATVGSASGGAAGEDLVRILAGLPARAPAAPRPRALRAFVLGAAAGLAAGVLVMSEPFRGGASGAEPPGESASFARPTPPPLARTGGELAQLGSYLRR